MNLLYFLIRRAFSLLIVVIGVSLLTFCISRIIPADPARLIAGPRASPEGVATVRHEYGLDLPLWQQYWRYMSNLLKFDLGRSFSSLRPVRQDLIEYFPATLELVFFSFSLALLIPIPLAVLSVLSEDGWVETTSRIYTAIGVSIPAFWLGILCQLFFYYILDIFPFGERIDSSLIYPPHITGFLVIDGILSGSTRVVVNAVYHLLLPGFVLSLEPSAFIYRFARNNLLESLQENYVIMARAKGLSLRQVVIRHVLPNTLLSVITVAGLLLGYLLNGAVLVEIVFAWPGIGRYAARALVSSDYNAIMGITILMAISYVVINSLVDWLYFTVDPRVRV